MNDVDIMFNSHKLKYNIMNDYFNFDIREKKTIYFFIDFDFILSKYLYTIDYHSSKDMVITKEMTDEFLINFLNLISHYKSYFYNKCDCLSFFYITINNKKYIKDKNVSDMIVNIAKIITMIPRIFIIYDQSNEESFYLKYNLIKKIILLRSSQDYKLIFLDLGRSENTELFYKLTKNYYVFKYDNYRIYLYGFNEFRDSELRDIDPKYYNSIISLLTVYLSLSTLKVSNSFRMNNIIMKYIKDHPNDDYNSIETKLLIIKMFSRSNTLRKRLIYLEKQLNSPAYGIMIEIIMKNWKHVIKDKNILRINELLNIPTNKRINIELLMNS